MLLIQYICPALPFSSVSPATTSLRVLTIFQDPAKSSPCYIWYPYNPFFIPLSKLFLYMQIFLKLFNDVSHLKEKAPDPQHGTRPLALWLCGPAQPGSAPFPSRLPLVRPSVRTCCFADGSRFLSLLRLCKGVPSADHLLLVCLQHSW